MLVGDVNHSVQACLHCLGPCMHAGMVLVLDAGALLKQHGALWHAGYNALYVHQ